MDFSLNQDQTQIRDSARDFLNAEWPTAELRRLLDPSDSAASTEAVWGKMAELGWAGLLVSEDNGGLGLGMFDLAVLMEETGRRLVPGTLHASGVLAAAALEAMGTDEASQQYLPDLAEGSTKATVGIYEAGSGWTPMLLEPNGGGTVTKRFVPEAGAADLVLVLCRTGGNAVELCVAHGPTISSQNSMDATRQLFEVTCKPGTLERIGTGTIADLQATVDKATIALAAEMVGSAAQVLDMTVEYVKNRKQFGRPVGTFQAVQHKAADMLIKIEKGRTAAYYAAAVADEQPERLGEAASIAKATANTMLVECAEAAIQLHGGQGFTWEQDLHLYLKRAKACEFTYGDTKWHLDRIAHGLGLA